MKKEPSEKGLGSQKRTSSSRNGHNPSIMKTETSTRSFGSPASLQAPKRMSSFLGTAAFAAEAMKSGIKDTSCRVLDTSGKVLHSTAKAPALATKAVKNSNKAYKESKLQALLHTHKNATKEKERTFEKLQHLERHRRAVLKKTEIGNPFFCLLFYEGAGVAPTIQDPALLFTLLVYVVSRLLVHTKYHDDDKTDLFDHIQLGLFGGLLNLFQIMFLQQNYARFQKRYMHSMSVEGRLFDLSMLAHSHLDKWTAHRLVRYINAAHIAGYCGLSRTYTTQNFFDSFNDDWKLLNKQETQRMIDINMDSGSYAYREILVWCLTIVQDAHKEGQIDQILANLFREKLLNIRSNFAKLYDLADQPLPFFFMYFVDYLQILYLPLLAATIAFSTPVEPRSPFTEFVAAAAVLLGSFFTVGMRVFGYMIDDPYGDDLTDLSVLTYVTSMLKGTFKIISAPHLAAFDEDEEVALFETRTESRGEVEIIFEEDDDKTDEDAWGGTKRTVEESESDCLSDAPVPVALPV